MDLLDKKITIMEKGVNTLYTKKKENIAFSNGGWDNISFCTFCEYMTREKWNPKFCDSCFYYSGDFTHKTKWRLNKKRFAFVRRTKYRI